MGAGRWISDEMYAFATTLVRMTECMAAAVKSQATRNPSPTGLYAACVVFNDKGEIVGVDGEPTVFCPPFGVAGISGDTVGLFHPDQHVRPERVADLAGVNKATVYRAVNEGKLPPPAKPTERVAVFKLTDVQRWLGTREKAKRSA